MSDTVKPLIEEFAGKPGRVDADKGVLYDCLLLGPESRNGTLYTEQTRADAVPLFEGAKINLSHPAKRDKSALTESTPWDRRYGKAFECRNTPEGIRGNVKVLKRHKFTPTLMEAAEEMPDMFGFSPVMLGVCTPRDANGVETCVKIKKVRSIDIVTDPGTTRTIFEEWDMDKELREEEAETEKKEAGATAESTEDDSSTPRGKESALLHTILDEIEDFLDRKQDGGEATKRVGQHLAHHAKMHFGDDKEGDKEEKKEGDKEEKKEDAASIVDAEKEEEEKPTLSRDYAGWSGLRVLTEEAKKPVEVKKVKSGTKPAQKPTSDSEWAAFLRK